MTARFLPTLLCAPLLLAWLVGCATTAATDAEGPPPPADARLRPAQTRFPRITLQQEASVLNLTVREISEQYGGGLVVMNGVGTLPLPPLEFKNAKYDKVVRALAKATGLKLYRSGFYYFLYPKGYESLLDVSLPEAAATRYVDATAGFSFAENTRLFNAFALLGHGLGMTIIADNAVGNSRSGEISLAEVPFADGLAALLRSARLDSSAYRVEATEEYLFLYSAANAQSMDKLANPAALSQEERNLLDKKVDIILPKPLGGGNLVPFHSSATRMKGILDALSRQLGIAATVEKEVAEFPVTPCVMTQVRVRTAMSLLLRQWLDPRYVYELREGTLHIRRQD